MGNKLLTYKRMVNTMVIITETLICGGLFGLFYSWAQGSSWEKTMGVPQTQIMLTLMLCYFITAINTGFRSTTAKYMLTGLWATWCRICLSSPFWRDVSSP